MVRNQRAFERFLENNCCLLGYVDNASPETLRPEARPRDLGILKNETTDCADKDLTGSRGRAARRRALNGQQTLLFLSKNCNLSIIN